MSLADHSYHIIPLEECHAWEILSWKYPTPYDFYNAPVDDYGAHYVRQFMRPDLQFHAVLDEHETLVGFCSFGLDGQVAGGNYEESALDIGLGMKPALTGQGRGQGFFEAILQHGLSLSQLEKIRLTVADFNRRALTLYQKFGFEQKECFLDDLTQVPYTILVRPAS